MYPLKAATLVAALSITASFSAFAAPCAALPYEELKDMSVEELKGELCTVWTNADAARIEYLETSLAHDPVDDPADPAAQQALETQAGQCDNEATRIKRMLARKGQDASALTFASTCKKGKT